MSCENETSSSDGTWDGEADIGKQEVGGSPPVQDVESGNPPRRSRLSSAVETFSPNWYAVCMNTGLFGILLHQFPYPFPGSGVLSTIFYISDVALFVLFTLIQIIRHILYSKAVLRQTSASMDEMCFWGCLPIALTTIVAQTGPTGSTATTWSESAQQGFTIFAIVLWYIDVVIMLTVAFTVYYLMAKWRMHEKTPIPPGTFLPAVGTTTVALVGGVIVNTSYDMSAHLAVPIIIVSYLLNGFGWWLATSIYPIFLNEIWSTGLLPAAKLPAMMMLVGPPGQAGVALQVLGTACETYFGKYGKGTFFQAENGAGMLNASMMLALLMLGFDIFWVVFIGCALLEKAFKRELVSSMPWWSTIFPVGTINTTFIMLGQEMDSPTFRVLGTGLFLVLLVDYLCCWVMTIRLVYKGKLLDGRQKIQKMP